MATLNIDLLTEALDDKLLGPAVAPRRYLHSSVGTCNRILAYIAAADKGGRDREQIAHHCQITPNTAAQYTRALEDLGLIDVQARGQGGKNAYFLAQRE